MYCCYGVHYDLPLMFSYNIVMNYYTFTVKSNSTKTQQSMEGKGRRKQIKEGKKNKGRKKK